MPRERLPRALLVVTDAGGGHRAAANALIAAAEERKSPLCLRILRLQEVLAPADFARPLLRNSMEESYNELIRSGRTRFLVPLLRLLQLSIRLLRGRLVRLLAARLRAEQADLVVSLMPNFNAVIRDAVRSLPDPVPFFVLMTDYADFPRHFWLEPGIDRVLVGTPHAERQAALAGIPPERVTRLSGMPLHPRHYQAGRAEARGRMRATLGVRGEGFVLMLLFGGKGAPEMRPLAEALLRAHSGWHVVAVAGDNPALFASLAQLAVGSGGRLHVLGFTDRVAELLAASDLLLTKPGPGSLAEAWHGGVPVVVACNGRTVPQERWNARMILDQRLGLVVGDWREMARAAAELLGSEDRLRGLRQGLRELPQNRAVYEALAILEAAACR